MVRLGDRFATTSSPKPKQYSWHHQPMCPPSARLAVIWKAAYQRCAEPSLPFLVFTGARRHIFPSDWALPRPGLARKNLITQHDLNGSSWVSSRAEVSTSAFLCNCEVSGTQSLFVIKNGSPGRMSLSPKRKGQYIFSALSNSEGKKDLFLRLFAELLVPAEEFPSLLYQVLSLASFPGSRPLTQLLISK